MKRILFITLALLCFCAPLAGCKGKKATPDTSSDTSHELKPYQGEYPTTDDQILVSFDGETLWCVGKDGIVFSGSIDCENSVWLSDYETMISSGERTTKDPLSYNFATPQERRECLQMIFQDQALLFNPTQEPVPDSGKRLVNLGIRSEEDMSLFCLFSNGYIKLYLDSNHQYLSKSVDLTDLFQTYFPSKMEKTAK